MKNTILFVVILCLLLVPSVGFITADGTQGSEITSSELNEASEHLGNEFEPNQSPLIEETEFKQFVEQNHRAVDWSPAASSIAFGGGNYTLFVTDSSLTSSWNSSSLGDWIVGVEFSPDGKIIAASTINRGTFFFDTVTGDHLNHSKFGGWGITWSPDGNYLGIQDKIISYNDLNTTLIELVGHDYIEFDIEWHPFLPLVATGAGDHTTRIWNTTTGEKLHTIQTNGVWVGEVEWSPNGFGLLIGVRNGDLVYYDMVMNQANLWYSFNTAMDDFSWDSAGSHLALAEDHYLYVGRSDTYDSADWVKSSFISQEFSGLDWSPAGDKIVTIHAGGYVRIWSIDRANIDELETTSSPTTIYTHDTYVKDIQQIGDSLYFSEASGSGGDGEIFEYDISHGTVTSYLNVSLDDINGFWAGGFHIYETGVNHIVHISEGNIQGANIYQTTVYHTGHVESWKLIETKHLAYDVVYLGCDTLLYTDFDDSVYKIEQGTESLKWKFELFIPTFISYSFQYGDFFVGDYSNREGDVGIARIRNGGLMTYNPGYTGFATDDFYQGFYLNDAVDSMNIAFVDVSTSTVSSDDPPLRVPNVCDRTTTDTVTVTETTTESIDGNTDGVGSENTTNEETADDDNFVDVGVPISPLFILPLFLIPLFIRKRQQYL